MSKEKIEFKEAIELFLYKVIPDIMSENEVPKVNFIFPPASFKLFNYVKEHPFTKENYLIPDIKESDITRLLPSNQQDPSCPTIIVKDPLKFFQLLTDITNSWLKQKDKYFGYGSARSLFIRGIRRIWLRMNPNDFNNVEDFLSRQLSFLKSTTFDEYINKTIPISTYLDYTIKATKEENETWCETNDKMTLTLHDNQEEYHQLPSIYFAIEEQESQTICYIYAIQNSTNKKTNKKISRSLYKLNAGIPNPIVHPSAVLALKIFIEMLSNRGITTVKVPCLQVLSYRYHQLLAEETKNNFERRWADTTFDMMRLMNTSEKRRLLEEYFHDKTWYEHLVNKEDFISQNKTENLYNIFYRLEEQFGTITILNDPFIQDEYLNIQINPIKKQIKR